MPAGSPRPPSTAEDSPTKMAPKPARGITVPFLWTRLGAAIPLDAQPVAVRLCSGYLGPIVNPPRPDRRTAGSGHELPVFVHRCHRYLVIDLIVASGHAFFANLNALMPILSAVLAVLLWPLVILGVDLHLR